MIRKREPSLAGKKKKGRGARPNETNAEEGSEEDEERKTKESEGEEELWKKAVLEKQAGTCAVQAERNEMSRRKKLRKRA